MAGNTKFIQHFAVPELLGLTSKQNHLSPWCTKRTQTSVLLQPRFWIVCLYCCLAALHGLCLFFLLSVWLECSSTLTGCCYLFANVSTSSQHDLWKNSVESYQLLAKHPNGRTCTENHIRSLKCQKLPKTAVGFPKRLPSRQVVPEHEYMAYIFHGHGPGKFRRFGVRIWFDHWLSKGPWNL